MTNFTSYQPHLSNANYLVEAIEKEAFLRSYGGLDCPIAVDDLSMSLASGYGTWKAVLTLNIDGTKKVYSLTHHNEHWYTSQKMVYDNSIADTEEELEEGIGAFQTAYEAVIDTYIDRIFDACIAAVEMEDE